MKLIIQIPCLNEEDQLPISIPALPRQVEGFDVVELLIIDDGSTDNTDDLNSNVRRFGILDQRPERSLQTFAFVIRGNYDGDFRFHFTKR